MRQGSARARLAAVALMALGLTAVATPASEQTAADGLARLKAGNARFVASPSDALPVDRERRAALVAGQSPFAAILSCADSRVPPEVVFHAGLGELFVIRAAGHVADKAVMASVEYAAEHLRVPLLVVMGHDMCGAVRAAIDTAPGASLGPNLDYLLKAIRPAVARTASQPSDTRLRAAILANVEETINDLLKGSAIVSHRAGAGRLALVGAYYELATGRVHFSDVVFAPVAPAPAATHH